jgi:Family of unknown function (DUF6304)
MTITYSARYKDRFGEEATSILNDCEKLTMVVRGIRFQGTDFDSFEPQDGADSAQLSSFTFLHGSLCFCVIEANIPIPVVTPTGIVDGLLTFELELGEPLPTGQMDRERLKLALAVNGQNYSSEGKTGWFEGEMVDLLGMLPPGTYMRACINCAFSDYSPYGHGLFGNLICFRANKVGYLALPSGQDFCKDAYFAVMDTVSEMVQETYLCPEFERRAPGTGYRG